MYIKSDAQVSARLLESREAAVKAGTLDKCRKCGNLYADGGDGYDGMCPSCADADEREHEPEVA